MSRQAPLILLLSDGPFGPALATELIADGFTVTRALSAAHARSLAAGRAPALAVLAPLAGGERAGALIEEIRASPSGSCWDSSLPLIAIGSRGGGMDAIRALESGADDFLVMPVSYIELRERIRAILRRAAAGARGAELRAGLLRVDLEARRAHLGEHELDLAPIEFELLAHLLRDPLRAFTRQQLLSAIWGYPTGTRTRTLDTHASRLRRKLAAASGDRWITAVRGTGYRLS